MSSSCTRLQISRFLQFFCSLKVERIAHVSHGFILPIAFIHRLPLMDPLSSTASIVTLIDFCHASIKLSLRFIHAPYHARKLRRRLKTLRAIVNMLAQDLVNLGQHDSRFALGQAAIESAHRLLWELTSKAMAFRKKRESPSSLRRRMEKKLQRAWRRLCWTLSSSETKEKIERVKEHIDVLRTIRISMTVVERCSAFSRYVMANESAANQLPARQAEFPKSRSFLSKVTSIVTCQAKWAVGIIGGTAVGGPVGMAALQLFWMKHEGEHDKESCRLGAACIFSGLEDM